MAKLSTQPVLNCSRPGCTGKVRVASLETFAPDPDGSIMRGLLQAAGQNALCNYHKLQRAYYLSRGRLAEWESGNL